MERFFLSVHSVTKGTHVEVLVKKKTNTVNMCRYFSKTELKEHRSK